MSIRSAIARTAFETLRANPTHTLMSISGLVIGVAALVGVLSLADGMEDFARKQVDTTTDLQSINVSVRTNEIVDGVSIQRASIPVLEAEMIGSLQNLLLGQATVVLFSQRNAVISVPGDSVRSAARMVAATAGAADLMPGTLTEGRQLTEEDVLLDSVLVEIVGVVELENNAPVGVLVPISVSQIVPSGTRPTMIVKAGLVEDIPVIKNTILTWADAHFKEGGAALEIQTNEMRVEQVQKGVRLFKIIMGLITGISVLVGGVGIMNVLMMSVKERTKEIGVRKAVGARKSHIIFQFMIESIAISTVGCAVGLLTGLA
jgi:putative ABC transport system permease protein